MFFSGGKIVLCWVVLAGLSAEASDCGVPYAKLPPLTHQITDYHCGAACATSVLAHSVGVQKSQEEVAAILGTNSLLGTTPANLAAGLTKMGVDSHVETEMSLQKLGENFFAGRSQILLTHDGEAHWIVLADIKDGKYVVMNPWHEYPDYLTYSEEEFLKIWKTNFDGRDVANLAVVTAPHVAPPVPVR